MATVAQPSALPTNKLSAALILTALWDLLEPTAAAAVGWLGEATGIGFTLTPNLSLVLQLAFAGGFSYFFIKDSPNAKTTS